MRAAGRNAASFLKELHNALADHGWRVSCSLENTIREWAPSGYPVQIALRGNMTEWNQKWPKHIVIVRHGESERNVDREKADAEGRAEYGQGVRDVDVKLTERGCNQARATGKYLQEKFVFDIAYTSPYERTRHTTELLLEGLNPRPEMVLEERIREKEFGILDGMTKVGIQAHFPEEADRKAQINKYYYRPPGGESYPDVNLRIHSFLGTLVREWAGKSVLVVCHSVVVLSFRRMLERLTEEELLRIDADPTQEVRNCSITWYDFESRATTPRAIKPRLFNAVYYPGELASWEPSRTKENP